jgi:hypothetical protein
VGDIESDLGEVAGVDDAVSGERRLTLRQFRGCGRG